MKKCFSGYFRDYEMVFPKSSVNFNYGYGIVEADFNIQYNGVIYSEPLIGIVDKNYNFIFDLVPRFVVPKIEIFSNDIFIVKYNDGLDREFPLYNVYLYTLNENNCLQNLLDFNALDFEKIDENLILLKSNIQGFQIVALFDVTKKDILTPYYSSIGKFQYNSEFKLDAAKVLLNIIDNSDCISLGFYISKTGEVLSPYLDMNTNEVYDKNIDLNDVINFAVEKAKSNSR